MRRLLAAAVPVCCFVVAAHAQRKVTQLATGVYAIEHQDDAFGAGNTTVIIGDRQVLVVDAGFLPSVAKEDIAQIRQWTDKPVTFLVNTHFHNDHNFGNRAYLEAFSNLTIIAHVETKRDMDMFGPGSQGREEKTITRLREILAAGKTKDGRSLTTEEKAQVKNALAERAPVVEDLKKSPFQSATLTFDHDFTIDLGNREVQIKFLGRGNTNGDAVVYLPAEKVAVAGDLVVYPIPYTFDGYPSEWIRTLQRLAQLDASQIVPGHGPILHDKVYISLLGELLTSAIDQLNVMLRQTGPAMFRTLDEARKAIDLTPFRARFAGTDPQLAAQFDGMARDLAKIVFQEASAR